MSDIRLQSTGCIFAILLKPPPNVNEPPRETRRRTQIGIAKQRRYGPPYDSSVQDFVK